MKKSLTVITIYLILTAYFTYPLVSRAHNSLFVPSRFNVPDVVIKDGISVKQPRIPEYLRDDGYIAEAPDALLGVWRLYHNYDRFINGLSNFFDSNIFYPFRGTFYYSDLHLTDTILCLPVILATDNFVLAYNYLGFLYIFLSAYFMYLFLYELVGRKFAVAVMGGAFFSFSIYWSARLDHILLNLYWLPLVFLSVLKYAKYGKKRYLLLLVVVLVAQSLSTWNAAVLIWMAFLGILLYYVFALNDKVKLKNLILSAIVAIVPVAYLAIAYFVHLRMYTNILRNFLFFTDYILPSPNMAIWSKIIYPAISKVKLIGVSRILIAHPDKCIFPGFILYFLGFSGMAIFIRKKVKLEKENLTVIRYLLIMLCVSFLLSIGPNFFPASSFLNEVVCNIFRFMKSPLRTPARFYILFQFSLMVFSALGISKVMKRSKVIASLLILLWGVETFCVHPEMNRVPSKEGLPPVYSRVSGITADVSILELPFGTMRSQEYFYQRDIPRDLVGLTASLTETRYMYYSIYHRRNIFNGFNAVSPPDYLYLVREMAKFPDEMSLDLIQNLNIDYVIVHSGLYQAISDGGNDVLGRTEEILKNRAAYDKYIAGIEAIGNDYLVRMKKSGRKFRGYYHWYLDWFLRNKGMLADGEKITFVDVLSHKNINSYILDKNNLRISAMPDPQGYLCHSFIAGNVLKKKEWEEKADLTFRIPLRPEVKKCFVYYEGPLIDPESVLFDLKSNDYDLQLVFRDLYQALFLIESRGQDDPAQELVMDIKLGVKHYPFVRRLYLVYAQ